MVSISARVVKEMDLAKLKAKNGKPLELAVANCEKAESAYSRAPDTKTYAALAVALAAVKAAVAKVVQELDRKQHGDVLKDLQEIEKLAEKRRKECEAEVKALEAEAAKEEAKARIEEAKARQEEAKARQAAAKAEKLEEEEEEEETDEEPEDGGADPDLAALRSLMKNLPKDPMPFAVVLDGESIQMMLHKTAGGSQLLAKLKKKTGCEKGTFGVANCESGVIGLDVQGQAITGLAKMVQQFLKDNAPMPFTKAALLTVGLGEAGGEPTADDATLTDTEDVEGEAEETPPASVPLHVKAPVGVSGRNLPEDVAAVQAKLNERNAAGLKVTGKISPSTILAIKSFQTKMGFRMPDGRVDPGGYTERGLNGEKVALPKGGPGGGPKPGGGGSTPGAGGAPKETRLPDGTYRMDYPDGTVEILDAKGQIVERREPGGKKVNMRRDEEGNVTRTTELPGGGRRVEYPNGAVEEYGPDGKLIGPTSKVGGA